MASPAKSREHIVAVTFGWSEDGTVDLLLGRSSLQAGVAGSSYAEGGHDSQRLHPIPCAVKVVEIITGHKCMKYRGYLPLDGCHPPPWSMRGDTCLHHGMGRSDEGVGISSVHSRQIWRPNVGRVRWA